MLRNFRLAINIFWTSNPWKNSFKVNSCSGISGKHICFVKFMNVSRYGA